MRHLPMPSTRSRHVTQKDGLPIVAMPFTDLKSGLTSVHISAGRINKELGNFRATYFSVLDKWRIVMRLKLTHQHALPVFSRRTAALALVCAPAVWTGVRAQPAPLRFATPGQTEGPFYPLTLPPDADFDLLRNGTRQYTWGQASWLEGSVMDMEGRPVAGALVEIWQCDHAGHYDHPGDGSRMDKSFQGFGRVTVNAQGEYRFRTIRPVAYGGRAPHIHLKVKLRSRELLTTQVYVAGDPLNAEDFLWQNLPDDSARAALTVPFTATPSGLRAQFPIVVKT